MLVARKGLPGHAFYDRSRNALEVLERLRVVDPAKRWSEAKALRELDGASAGGLLHLGFEISALLKAGYAQADLRSVDGVTEDALQRACLLYTSPSPRDQRGSRMPSSA